MRIMRAVLLIPALLILLLVSTSGGFLIVDNPRHADVIVALAGETDHRPARALDLLRQGYAPKLLLDVPANFTIYNQQMVAIAEAYVNHLPDGQKIAICPITGFSTKAEVRDVTRCLGDSPSRHILVVTSDYHTRRALSIFRHELPGHEISIAAASDNIQFGSSWWRNRQWAKINFDEWVRLVWWEAIDRWR
jgi:hypothetical protein